MTEIVKIYRESLPELRLIGLRYTDVDRENGGFGHKWGEFFQSRTAEKLKNTGAVPVNGCDNVGCMRCIDEFEYWIGAFFATNTAVPEGFSYVDIPAGDIGTCWIYGNGDNGEVYGMKPHEMCMEKIKEAGWNVQDNAWFFERYDEKRFMEKDEKGNIILDYCAYLV